MKPLFFMLMVMMSITFHVYGQSFDTKISGKVLNEQNTPVSYATVALLGSDSLFVRGDVSKDNGSFVFEGVRPGTYFLSIQSIEYVPYSGGLFSLAAGEKKEINDIQLAINSNELNEVLVTAKKAVIEVRADMMVFNVSASPNTAGNNGLELLAKSPGVIVDPDNNIILQGKNGVQVFINGRPTRLSGTDLASMLQSMRADNIESIELITNPSAKYEAEGNAGIINIRLKKNVNLGFNGNLTSSFSQGTYSRSSLGTALFYKGDKWNLSGDIIASDDSYQDDLLDTKNQSGFSFDQKAYSLNNRNGINASTGIDYTINSNQSLSLSGRGIFNDNRNELKSFTSISSTLNKQDGEILNSQTLDDMPTQNYNLNLNYLNAINDNTSLSADISYGYYVNNKSTDQPNDYTSLDGQNILRSPHNAFDANTKINLASAKVDFERKFKSVSLSAGGKFSNISTENQFSFYDVKNGENLLDKTKSNDFNYKEKVSAAYAILNAKPSEVFSFNIGLRVENTSSIGSLISDLPVNDSEVKRNYTNFFPNVSVSLTDTKNHQLSLSYGRRITRPNYQDLNPFESRLSELVAWKGNPFLNPKYITNFNMTYSFKKKLVISNTYSIIHDFFATIFEIVNEKGNFLIPRNMDGATTNGLAVSYPQQIYKWWNIATFLNYNYSLYKGNLGGTVIDLKANIFNGRLQNSFQLPGKISMDLNYNYSSPWIWRGTIYVEGNHRVDVGLRKSFFDNRLQLTLTDSDILRTGSDYYYNSNYGGQEISGVRTFDNQRVGLSASVKFGNQKVKVNKKNKSAIDEELNRISG